MDYKGLVCDTVYAVVEGISAQEGATAPSSWAERGFFVVEISCKASAAGVDEVEVAVDSDGVTGVGIDDCVLLSREISARLMAVLPRVNPDEDPDFALSVMSAGLGQPLKLGRQYQKLMRRALERDTLPLVDVLFKDGRKLSGVVLCGVGYSGGDADVPSAIEVMYEVKELVEGKKRKELVEKREQVALMETKAVTEHFDFK